MLALKCHINQLYTCNILRLDYCGFGPFCNTGTKLLSSISLLSGTHMYHISIYRQIIRLSNDMNNIIMDKRIFMKIN